MCFVDMVLVSLQVSCRKAQQDYCIFRSYTAGWCSFFFFSFGWMSLSAGRQLHLVTDFALEAFYGCTVKLKCN